MAYFLDLFSPETYEAFSKSDRAISGFRQRHQNAASRVKVGDKLICYMTKLSRWIGILEVQSEWFRDDTPIFYPADDPFIIRFKVKPVAWLPKDKAIPIHDNRVWGNLSFTRGYEQNTPQWTGKVRTSLTCRTTVFRNWQSKNTWLIFQTVSSTNMRKRLNKACVMRHALRWSQLRGAFYLSMPIICVDYFL